MALTNAERQARWQQRRKDRTQRLEAEINDLKQQLAQAQHEIEVLRVKLDEAIFDGEVIAADATGRPQFYDLLRRTRSPAYAAFDLLWLDGADLRPLPLSERRQRLHSVVPKGSASVSETLSVVGRGCELFDLMCTNDLEGIVAKRLADPYNSRVRWLKIKNRGYSQEEGRADLFNGPPRSAR